MVSTYLGRDPKFVKRNVDAFKSEAATYAQFGTRPRNPPLADVWQDIFAKYQALADPAQGLARRGGWGAVKMGDSRSHALDWLLSLQEMGVPDFGVTADTPLSSVFRRPEGRKPYLPFNASKAPLNVLISDGKAPQVAPGTLARTN